MSEYTKTRLNMIKIGWKPIMCC